MTKRKFASAETRKRQQEGYRRFLTKMGKTGGHKAGITKRLAKTKVSLAPVKGVNS